MKNAIDIQKDIEYLRSKYVELESNLSDLEFRTEIATQNIDATMRKDYNKLVQAIERVRKEQPASAPIRGCVNNFLQFLGKVTLFLLTAVVGSVIPYILLLSLAILAAVPIHISEGFFVILSLMSGIVSGSLYLINLE